MPLGIISEEDLLKELGNSNKEAIKEEQVRAPEVTISEEVIIKDLPTIGRPEGKKEVPEPLRKLIGEEALNGTSFAELKREFDVSISSISAYKKGATSTATYNKPEPELKNHVDNVRKQIQERAGNKLQVALDSMKPEKFEKASLRVLAGVASQLSAVVKNMEPDNRQDRNDAPLAQFIFHVPPMKKEEQYEVIEVDN